MALRYAAKQLGNPEGQSMCQAVEVSRAPYVKAAKAAKADADAVHLRTHTISVRINSQELAWLTRASETARLMKGTYLRVAALGQHRAVISELNQQGLQLLGEASENVLRIADSLEELKMDRIAYQCDLTALMGEMQHIRQLLVGALGPEAAQGL